MKNKFLVPMIGETLYVPFHSVNTPLYPPYSIGMDIDFELVCQELPILNLSDNRFERYTLVFKKVHLLRFYCCHRSSEPPSGNGTADNPWNNFFEALKKLSQIKTICREFIQLVILPESDTITLSHYDQMLAADDISDHLIIGSFDKQTFFNIKVTSSVRIYAFMLSQCNIDAYNTGIEANTLYHCDLRTFGASISRTINSTVLFRQNYERENNYGPAGILYGSYLYGQDFEYHRIRIGDVIKSEIYIPKCGNNDIKIGHLVDSKLQVPDTWQKGKSGGYGDAHINHMYKSDVEINNFRLNNVYTIIDSVITSKSILSNCIKLTGGWKDETLDTAGQLAIISNAKIRYTYRPAGMSPVNDWNGGQSSELYTWGALAFCVAQEYYNAQLPVVVSDCDCSITIAEHSSNTQIDPPVNIWTCVFPPGCDLPSKCSIIKGGYGDFICGSCKW